MKKIFSIVLITLNFSCNFYCNQYKQINWKKTISDNIETKVGLINIYDFVNVRVGLEQKKEGLVLNIYKGNKEINKETLFWERDITLEPQTGFLSFNYDNKKYFYIPDEYYPVAFQEGYQSSVPFSQEYLSGLDKWEWTFVFGKITTSSFLKENTKNGVWKYDGQDIEKFPILSDPDNKYNFISMPWVEGVKGDGIGEWIELEGNPKKIGVFRTLKILNGYVDVRKPHLYKQNNRIKEATLICTPVDPDEKEFEIKIDFEDFVYVKQISLGKLCTKVRLVIDSVYKGTKYDDTVITSIYTNDTQYSPI